MPTQSHGEDFINWKQETKREGNERQPRLGIPKKCVFTKDEVWHNLPCKVIFSLKCTNTVLQKENKQTNKKKKRKKEEKHLLKKMENKIEVVWGSGK